MSKPKAVTFGDRYDDDSGWQLVVSVNTVEAKDSLAVKVNEEMYLSIPEARRLAELINLALEAVGEESDE